jgi:hypothetical protein
VVEGSRVQFASPVLLVPLDLWMEEDIVVKGNGTVQPEGLVTAQ